MEWNRWPADDAHSCPNTELHENLLREREQGGCLDLAMALKDQDHLFNSIKMKKMFPELIQTRKEEVEEEKRKEKERRNEREKQRKAALEKEEAEKAAAKEASIATWGPLGTYSPYGKKDEDEDENGNDFEVEYERELTREERETLAWHTQVDDELLENYNAWERMFSMEKGGCREATGPAVEGRGQGQAEGRGLDTVTEEDIETVDSCAGAKASNTCKHVSSASAATSLASNLKRKKKKFVYGHVEPMKIITVRTFKIPNSYTSRQVRIRNPGFYKRKHQAADTSDLGVGLDKMPVWQEVQVRGRNSSLH